MNTLWTSILLGACSLWLSACDKTPTTPPSPMVVKSVTNEPGVAVNPVTDPSMPTTPSAVPAAREPTDGTRVPSKESTSAPMPGQNNDHSAPLSSAKPASSP